MPGIPLVSIEQMTPPQRAQYDRFPSNLTRGLLLLDDRLAGALPELANALRASGLDPRLREAVILRVAALHKSAYERMQHLGQAHKAGLSDDEIQSIESGSPNRADAALATILSFTDACVSSPSVPDDIFEAVSRILSPRHVATLIVLVGHYMTVARYIGILQIPLDAHADSWEHEH